MRTVFLIDDHPVVAQGIALVLEEQEDLVFIGAAGTPAAARRRLADDRPDIVLLDVRIPGADVVGAVADIHAAVETAAIVLFTADPHHPDVPAALRAGACGTISKDTTPEALRGLLRAVVAGQALPGRTPHEAVLTPRQHDVLIRVATGLTNAEIADELGVRPATVKTYWQEAMQRLGVRNRAEAITVAHQRGLL